LTTAHMLTTIGASSCLPSLMQQLLGSEQPEATRQRTSSNAEQQGPQQQQQQHQQQQGAAGSQSMTLPELKRLLQQQLSAASYCNYSIALNRWSRACGSTDVKIMLLNAEALVQHVTAVDAAGKPTLSATTAGIYLYCASGLLKVPQVQQLLDAQTQENMRRQLKAGHALLQARAAAAAAAAADPAAAGGMAAQQQQQQQLQGEAADGCQQDSMTAAAGGVTGKAAAAAGAATPCAHCGGGAAAAAGTAGSPMPCSKRPADQQVRPGYLHLNVSLPVV
jgi:hypothetical protein